MIRQAVDEEFRRAAEAAGLDPEEAFQTEGEKGAGYNLSIIYAGALDKEAMVYLSYGGATLIAEELVEREQDPELEVLVTHTAVGPDYQEATGYGPYGRLSWDAEQEEVSKA